MPVAVSVLLLLHTVVGPGSDSLCVCVPECSVLLGVSPHSGSLSACKCMSELSCIEHHAQDV